MSTYDLEREVVISRPLTYSDTLVFSFPVEAKHNYRVELAVNHSTDYEYENVYFQVFRDFSEKDSSVDTFSVPLASQSGIWIGHCNRRRCIADYILYDSLRFDAAGEIRFLVVQHSREPLLKHINALEIGLKVL